MLYLRRLDILKTVYNNIFIHIKSLLTSKRPFKYIHKKIKRALNIY